MEIRIIAEASSKTDRDRGYWGLAILIDRQLLFDTFCDGAILHHAFQEQQIDIEAINYVVLSHEHWDHTGGLWWFLDENPHVTVFICPQFSNQFKSQLAAYPCTVVEVSHNQLIGGTIFSTGAIQATYKSNPIYEQALVITQNDRLILVTGCSHPGITTILHYVSKHYRFTSATIIGGLHLLTHSDEELEQIYTEFVHTYHIDHLAVGHCTGSNAIAYLKNRMPGQVQIIKSGTIIVPEFSN
jgi:7,8-dihydropterin-6-yl-methyl-4-(beta-D-ribofuranosyl)aminobenzene 5'-phosphate synthase